MSEVTLLESYFDFFYAREIINKMHFVLRQKCSGCRRGYLSQLDHECLTMKEQDRLELYFDDILREVDESSILHNWSAAVSVMSNILSALVAMSKLKFFCRDWRETDMKSPAWRARMKGMVTQIASLNRRVFVGALSTLDA